MKTCILTDKSALFPPALTSGKNFIRTFPLVEEQGKVQPPDVEAFERLFADLERNFDTVLFIAVSEKILPEAEAAWQAAQNRSQALKISILDSQQIGPGVGLLAQIAAQAIANQASLSEIEECLRAAIPHIYTLLCPEFNIPGEMDDGRVSIFSIEEGELNLYKKVRTRRHLLEALQEFIEEFEAPQQIAYFHGHLTSLRTRPLRGMASTFFPNVPFTELEINPVLANLFGPQTVGLTLMELPNEHRTRH